MKKKQKERDSFPLNNPQSLKERKDSLKKINDSFFYTIINLITKKIIQTKRVLSCLCY